MKRFLDYFRQPVREKLVGNWWETDGNIKPQKQKRPLIIEALNMVTVAGFHCRRPRIL